MIDKFMCKQMRRDTLDLLHRYKAENESLNNQVKQWEETAKDLFAVKEKQQEEIERLKCLDFQKSQNEFVLQLYNCGFFNPEMRSQALAAVSLMNFEGKEAAIEKIRGGML